MKISSKFLSYFKLDHSYSLLNCRNVSVLMEFFKALDVRGIMALDGTIYFSQLSSGPKILPEGTFYRPS